MCVTHFVNCLCIIAYYCGNKRLEQRNSTSRLLNKCKQNEIDSNNNSGLYTIQCIVNRYMISYGF